MELFYLLMGRGEDMVARWQMSIRAILLSTYVLTLYRILPRRAFGSGAAVDFVLVIIVGSSLSRALTGNAALEARLQRNVVLSVLT